MTENSADLGGYYPPRLSASVDNTLLDLQNSSYPNQSLSIIASTIVRLYTVKRNEEKKRKRKKSHDTVTRQRTSEHISCCM